MQESKTKFVGVRFTRAEVEKLQQVAEATAEGNLSAALRHLVRESRLVVRPPVVEIDHVEKHNRTDVRQDMSSAAVV